jgi:hypothetical protein
VEHVAGVPVRHPEMAAAGRHYGTKIATCVPADPESKGGSEAAVKIAKADLVPTVVNLREGYESFAALRAEAFAWCEHVNNRAHRETRRRPVQMLAEEQARLHPVPDDPYLAALGESRVVTRSRDLVGWDALLGPPPADRLSGVGPGRGRRGRNRPSRP